VPFYIDLTINGHQKTYKPHLITIDLWENANYPTI